MSFASTIHAHRLQEVYQGQGLVGSVFSVTRFLGSKVLPEPYETRYRYRSRLVQEALCPTTPSSLSTMQRLHLSLAGFDERLYFIYGFDRDVDTDAYLSEHARKCAGSINEHPELLRDKESFHSHLRDGGFSDYLPVQYGIIQDGEFRSDTHDDLRGLVQREQRIAIKEVVGGGGNRVYICERDADGMILHGKDNALYDPEQLIPTLDRSIVTEFCEQAGYLDRLYPDAANTLRVLTMNPDGEEAFIPAAVQRIGTNETGKLDNFSQGGLSAYVSPETGELGSAARVSAGPRVTRHATHPDTGARIEGIEIPGWAAIERQIRRIANRLPKLKYVGWDLLVTSPGEFVILEGNHAPDPDVIQVHRPLLEDPRVRDFLTSNGVPI